MDPQERVFEKGFPQAFSLLPLIHRQSRQQNDSDRMLGLAFYDSGGRFFTPDAARRLGIISNHRSAPMHNIGLRRVPLLIEKGETFQPFIQDFIAAVEWLQLMTLPQLFHFR